MLRSARFDGAPAIDASAPARARFRTVSIEALRNFVLWLFVACGATAIIEPSPYEFMFPIVVAAFAGANGLLFDRSLAPMIVTLALFNASGFLVLTPFVDDAKSVMFICISAYIALTAIVFAAIVARDPLRRMPVVRSGYAAAGVGAAVLGILGYFDIAGLGPLFTIYDNARASGPFKDPNVFAPFLVAPIVWTGQDLLLGRARRPLIAVMAIATMTLGVFLSFSRGAWGDCAASIALLIGLTLMTTNSPKLRRRVAAAAIAVVIGALLALMIVLTIPEIRAMFVERASLAQDYDVGETGRFGNQIRSLPLLLDRFFGFGPLQFRNIFTEDPHETYLNAFASYGWIGGLSYLAFTAAAVFVGWRLTLRKGPFQTEAIAVWSCLFVQMVQGFQIDTDHWRHLYLLFGLIFGLAAADRLDRRPRVDDAAGRRRALRIPAQGLAARRSLGADGVGVACEPAPVARLSDRAQRVVGLPEARQMPEVAVAPERRA
jgi:hypothetical protein